MITKELYEKYVEILKEELVPAMGCTEPVAIAYAGAKARQTLGCMPTGATVEVSGNIIKNVKSVVVPHTGGLRGIEAALAAGITLGDADAELEVLSKVQAEDVEKIKAYLNEHPVKVERLETDEVFEIIVTLTADCGYAKVCVIDSHTNIALIEKNGEVLYKNNTRTVKKKADRSCLSVENIVAFADQVHIEDVKEILDRQIEYNMAIAEEGIKNNWGANVGKVIYNSYPDDIAAKARAYAAAGSDARMNGCEMPVVINSGSGNQGITASVPVIVAAREMGFSQEKLYRALCLSNLLTIHLKSGIGTLSAYCGVISAGAGAGSAIAYMLGGGFKGVAHTLVNTLAIDSGIICDGAKASCAAKIAVAVESGLLGYKMYETGNQFYAGDGIVKKGVEKTIESVSRLAQDGMKGTDVEIIKIMTDECC